MIDLNTILNSAMSPEKVNKIKIATKTLSPKGTQSI